jgi:malonate-semialdehyde dehydrogenase (acetylating)/methylmalonate-semialdehyde dehydrogenase
MRTIEHRIGGKATSGSSTATAPVWDPATGGQQAEVALGSAADVEEAVRTATATFATWSQTSLSRRAEILFAFRELATARIGELAELVSAEHRNVLSDARDEIERGLEVVDLTDGIEFSRSKVLTERWPSSSGVLPANYSFPTSS